MKSFLKNLFDLSFNNFVAIHIVRVTFILGCLVGVISAVYFGNELQSLPDYWTSALLVIGLPPILFIAFVAVLRVTLEMYVALVRIAENTTKLVEMKDSKEALPVMRDDQTE